MQSEAYAEIVHKPLHGFLCWWCFNATAVLTLTSRDLAAGTEGPKISLRIDKAILSYKKPLERPVFSVTVVNSWGDPIGESIQTLPGEFESKTGIITFGHSVVLPEGIHKIPDGEQCPESKPDAVPEYHQLL